MNPFEDFGHAKFNAIPCPNMCGYGITWNESACCKRCVEGIHGKKCDNLLVIPVFTDEEKRREKEMSQEEYKEHVRRMKQLRKEKHVNDRNELLEEQEERIAAQAGLHGTVKVDDGKHENEEVKPKDVFL